MPKKLLVVATTTGYRHESIPALERMLTDPRARHRQVHRRFHRGAARAARRPAEERHAGTARRFRRGKAAWEPALKAALEKLAARLAEALRRRPLRQPDRRFAHSRQGRLSRVDPRGHAFIGLHSASDTFPRLARLRADARRRFQDARRPGRRRLPQPGPGESRDPHRCRKSGRSRRRRFTSSRITTPRRCTNSSSSTSIRTIRRPDISDFVVQDVRHGPRLLHRPRPSRRHHQSGPEPEEPEERAGDRAGVPRPRPRRDRVGARPEAVIEVAAVVRPWTDMDA